MSTVMIISGAIQTDKEITQEEVMDKFIDFVESNGWYFGGTVYKETESNEEESK